MHYFTAVEEMNDDADKWEDGTASVSNVLLAAESILPAGGRSNLLKGKTFTILMQ